MYFVKSSVHSCLLAWEMTTGISDSFPLWEIPVIGSLLSAPRLWFTGMLVTPMTTAKMTVCSTQLWKIIVMAKMQHTGSCLNHAEKLAVLSKTWAHISSIQLIYSLTWHTAGSAFIEVWLICCLLVFFLSHLILPVVCFLTILVCFPFSSLYKTPLQEMRIHIKASPTFPTRSLTSCYLNVIQN